MPSASASETLAIPIGALAVRGELEKQLAAREKALEHHFNSARIGVGSGVVALALAFALGVGAATLGTAAYVMGLSIAAGAAGMLGLGLVTIGLFGRSRAMEEAKALEVTRAQTLSMTNNPGLLQEMAKSISQQSNEPDASADIRKWVERSLKNAADPAKQR